MNFAKLSVPFPEGDIEWRLAQCGKKGDGSIWGTCLAYIQARAIMDRLDEVIGHANWKAEYSFIGTAGVICRLSIKIGDEWITKEDGAEATDIEPFKGGISGALKRAAVLWGIGRYLYNLESGFIREVDKSAPGARFGKTKEGAQFYWVPPRLPAWAIPGGDTAPVEAQPTAGLSRLQLNVPAPVVTNEPPAGLNGNPGTVLVPFGRNKGRPIFQIPVTELEGDLAYWETRARNDGKPLTGKPAEYIAAVRAFLDHKGPKTVTHDLPPMPDGPTYPVDESDAPF